MHFPARLPSWSLRPRIKYTWNTYLFLQVICSYNTCLLLNTLRETEAVELLCCVGGLETLWMPRSKMKAQARWVISQTGHIKNRENHTASFVLSQDKGKIKQPPRSPTRNLVLFMRWMSTPWRWVNSQSGCWEPASVLLVCLLLATGLTPARTPWHLIMELVWCYPHLV